MFTCTVTCTWISNHNSPKIDKKTLHHIIQTKKQGTMGTQYTNGYRTLDMSLLDLLSDTLDNVPLQVWMML